MIPAKFNKSVFVRVMFIALCFSQTTCGDYAVRRYEKKIDLQYKQYCSCSIGTDSIKFAPDSIIVYSTSGHGSFNLGHNSTNYIKENGLKKLMTDSAFLMYSTKIFYKDCYFKKYVYKAHTLELWKDGNFDNVIELYGKYNGNPRIIQILSASQTYIYTGDSTYGKCDNLIDSFFKCLNSYENQR